MMGSSEFRITRTELDWTEKKKQMLFERIENDKEFKEFLESDGFVFENGKIYLVTKRRILKPRPQPNENGMVTMTLD